MNSDIPVSCNRDCGGGCPLIAHVDNGKISEITDNPLRHPSLSGCIRGFRAMDTTYAEDRIRTPLLRKGERGSGTFTPVSWKTALDIAADHLEKARNTGGPESVLSLSGSGSCRGAVHNTTVLGNRLFTLYGATVTHGSYSCQALGFTTPYMYGTRTTGFDPETLEQSRLILLWGADIASLRFGTGFEYYIKRARKRGVPVIVIDPRKTRTARTLGTEWIPINPGSDRTFMAAILYTLVREDLADQDYLLRFTSGFEELKQYILGRADGIPKTPAWASPFCGIDEETITGLARRYGTTKPAALLPGFSIQRTLNGEDTSRYAVALQAATGNIGIPGGSSGGQFWLGLPVPSFPKIPVPQRTSGTSIPVYLWAEEVLKKKIKVIYNIGTNMVNQGSNIARNIQAFNQADFVCTHDFFLTPSARYSDLVLPVTTFLERNDVVFPSENYLYYSSKTVEPLYEARNDYDILKDLAELLGLGEQFTEGRSSDEWIDHLSKQSAVEDMEEFMRTGIFDGGNHTRVAFDAYITDPGANPLATPSGRIELTSAAFTEAGFNTVPEASANAPPEQYPLRLVTPHCRYRVNSQNSNLPWFKRMWNDVLEISYEDAGALNIEDGQTVLVESPDGKMRVPVSMTRDIFPGTVSFHQGSWFNTVDNIPSVNAVTSTVPSMPSHGSRTHTVFVRIEV